MYNTEIADEIPEWKNSVNHLHKIFNNIILNVT